MGPSPTDDSNFFSALEILSATAATLDSDGANNRTRLYADDSILIYSLPETPSSSASTSSQADLTLDLRSCKSSRSFFTKKKRSTVLRSRSKGAKIRSSESDEANVSINPSSVSDVESRRHSKQQSFGLLDVLKMMPTKRVRRFEGVDILEIAAMKGIYFPPSRWRNPRSYGADSALPPTAEREWLLPSGKYGLVKVFVPILHFMW